AALALVERRVAQLVADILERGVAAVARDREHRLQRGMQAAVGTLGRVGVLLQELAVGVDLDGEQERHLEDRAALAEILADALLLGEGILGAGVGHGACASLARSAAQARPGGNAWNRQLEVAGIAGTSTPCPATSDCQLMNVRGSVTCAAAESPDPGSATTAKGRGPWAPSLSVSSMPPDDAMRIT